MPEIMLEIVTDKEIVREKWLVNTSEDVAVRYLRTIDILHEGCEVLKVERDPFRKTTEVLFTHPIERGK